MTKMMILKVSQKCKQLNNARNRPRVGISKIPAGWSKDLILKVYTSPALKGNKMAWLKQWTAKFPEYPLSKQKVGYWINN